MIVFSNPGVIDLNAIRLMGVSVKQEGSFGRFGTGLKYTIATVLRGGGQVVLYSGGGTGTFKLKPTKVRGQAFSEVIMVWAAPNSRTYKNYPLGFTTLLGKDWEPWMAARELGCNAKDEGGEWQACPDDAVIDPPKQFTLFTVTWPAMEEAMASDAAHVFVPDSEELMHVNGVRCLAGASQYLYHRGVRVWKLPRPSVFTYDILSPVDLTEDRTVKYGFCVTADVRNALLAATDHGVIRAAVSAPKDAWESALDWSGDDWAQTDPGADWLEVVSAQREAGLGLSKSANGVLLKHTAYRQQESYYGGATLRAAGAFARVVEELGEIGIDMADLKVYTIEALPGDALSSVRNGAVYVSNALVAADPYTVARELLRRQLEIWCAGDFNALLERVIPILLKNSRQLQSFATEAKEKVDAA